MTARFIVADVFDGLAQLEDGSVDLVITSPPFLALRSYLPADHPDKGREIGSEATPAEFIDVMLRVTAELRRVLAPHGSIAVELGDTYAGSGGAGGDYMEDGLRAAQPPFRGSAYAKRYESVDGRTGPGRTKTGHLGWPLPKSKTLIPELYRVALAYGINPLTGAESPAGRWRIRNVATWARPNPPVGALGDKWRPATSDLVVACTSDKRYWDDLATRKPADPANKRPSELRREAIPGRTDQVMNPLGEDGQRIISNSGGAPLLDYWEIPPTGYSGSHYAVFPPALVEPCVKAMAPPKVCRTCGEPSRRIVETQRTFDGEPAELGALYPPGLGTGMSRNPQGAGHWRFGTNRQDLGWSDCGHDDYRPALILDCFAGSGTTGLVATGHGHDAVLIDIDERNCELARERIGPFMFEGPIYSNPPPPPAPDASPQTQVGAQ